MTESLNNRLSSVAFSVAPVAVICWAFLAFFVPHLEQLWSDDHQAMSAPLSALFGVSHLSHGIPLAVIAISLFAASSAWRIVAAKRLRNPVPRGFDVVQKVVVKEPGKQT